jgi:transposase
MRSSRRVKLRHMRTKPAVSKRRKTSSGQLTIGIDIGDQWSHYCTLNEIGDVIEEGRFRTTRSALAKHFSGIGAVRVAIENGTHSIWISEQLGGYGHEVIVANVQELQAISRSDRKCDRVDAEKLARYARVDPSILRPISHRSVSMQQDLTVVRAREVLVRVRTAISNAVRGLVKPCGFRLPKSASSCFAERCLSVLPIELAPALKPLLEQLHQITERIKAYDQLIAKMAKIDYPETLALDQVHGVGTLTALTFVLTVGNKHRFQRSRDVGCYLGLRPRRDQSGGHDPQLRITKAGNKYLRMLLVECANFILGPFGQDSTLRRWGLKLAQRGGKNARKRALTAVARKLAVLLHRLWVTQAEYEPFHESAAA